LLRQCHWKWPIPWQQWHLISDVRLAGTVDDEGFAATTPYKTEVLLRSIAWGATVEGVDDIEGAREAEGVIKE
jgi:hypothetical protein